MREDILTSDPVRDEGIVVSTQVAYMAEGGRLYDIEDTGSASTLVVPPYLTAGKCLAFRLSSRMNHARHIIAQFSLHSW